MKATTIWVAFFRGILTCAFAAMVIMSIKKLVEDETGTKSYQISEENSTFPSLAICPFMYSPQIEAIYEGQSKTFEDVISLPVLKDHINISMEVTKQTKDGNQ